MGLKKVDVVETEKAVEILRETAEWLQRRGSLQWAEVLDGKDKHGLAEAIKNGEVYFYFNQKNQLAGMLAAWNKPTAWDQQLWQKQQKTNSAIYIHRLLVRPNYRGKGYGKQMLDEVKELFHSKVTEIRLDCLASNEQLIAFYKGNGFRQVGTGKDLLNIKFELFAFFVG